jgi:hypothetical protein
MKTMHLYGQTLERYVTRALPAQELAAFDAHLSNCLFCAHTLAENTVATTRWERRGLLGRLVQVEAQPVAVTDEQELDSRAA